MAGPHYIDWPLDDEITRFDTQSMAYTARTMSGMVLRIVKAHAFQPLVENPDNFATFLWIEAVEGFFLLRQHLVMNQALNWRVLRRILPAPGQGHFFFEFLEVLGDYVRDQGLVAPFDTEGDVPGFMRFRTP